MDLADDLRASVRDYRNPQTTEAERQIILDFWSEYQITNQFQAMLKAAEVEKTR